MCLDVYESSIYAETNVDLYPWNKSNAQQWSIQKNGEGYKLQSRSNSFYLDVAGGGTESGTNIWVYQGTESAAQTFTFIPYTPFGDEGLTITVNPVEISMDELISNNYAVPLSLNAKLSPNFIKDEEIWKNKLKNGLRIFDIEFGLSFDERLNLSDLEYNWSTYNSFGWYVNMSWEFQKLELERNMDWGSVHLPKDVKPGDVFHIKYADKGQNEYTRHMYYFRLDSKYYDLAELGLVAWNDGYIKIKDELWLDESTVTMHFGDKYNIKANQTGLVYKTGNPDVAIVSKDGVVTAVGAGKTTILVYNSESEVKQLEVTVKEKIVDGDVNKDGNLDVTDVVMLQKWILSGKGAKLTNAKAADLNGDGVVDVFDLGLLKRKLLGKK
jgi:Dockerin type I repeat./Ricin-type beta-trefoil lectin domain.